MGTYTDGQQPRSNVALVLALTTLLGACAQQRVGAGLAAAPAALASPVASGDGAAAFAALSALVGDWEATTTTGAKVRASYRLVSGGGVLVETFFTASGKETLTVLHRDGPTLLATHYCAQGNQPRLRLSPSSDPTRQELTFLDVTNLGSPGASHLIRLAFEPKDAGHFDKTEVYVEDGREEATTLAFSRSVARAPPAAAP